MTTRDDKSSDAGYEDRPIWTTAMKRGAAPWEAGLAGVLAGLGAPDSVSERLLNPAFNEITRRSDLLLRVLRAASEMQDGVEVTFVERVYLDPADKSDDIVTVRYLPGATTREGVPPEETFSLRILFE